MPQFLEHIKVVSFGAFTNRVIGPFKPGLNVVFGHNEAGKTTLASFVGGVLFGWEEARGARNTYKPDNAERAGSLFFAERPAAACGGDAGEGAPAAPPQPLELSRVRNADGLQGDASLAADLDRETFRTMFSLTSDELRSLRNTTDVTAKLLTAGSGTGASPAHALARLQERLAGYTSRAAGIEHSLVNLSAQQDALLAQIAAAEADLERLKREDREFHELAPQRDDLNARLAATHAGIEALSACRAGAERLDDEIASLTSQIAARTAEEEELRAAHRLAMRERDGALAALPAAEERRLRDQLEALAAEEAKCEHAVDLAQDNFATSTALREALDEAELASVDAAHRRRQRRVQVALSVLLPVIFTAAGIPLFIHGREITSLSFTALGCGLVFIAVVMACAALVMLFKPNKEEEAWEARKQDAQWVMLQDKKKLEACLQNQEAFRLRMEEQLAAAGLAAAHGSLRRARALLDEAAELRAETALYQQRRQAVVSRRTALEESLSAAEEQRRALFARAGLPEGEPASAIDELIAQRTRQRSGLMEASERLNQRYGELKQELSQAKGRRDFDALKLRYHEVRTRMDESARDYARLLLARRTLEAAVAAWESTSQPEVYRQASRLMASMTGGRWVKVAMAADGRLQVSDSVHTKRDPLHLSLGTCQQLYLALRIALLMTADNVGRSIPILADDILVNFDAERRAGAARALAELATKRQVILFTCHEEIVEALRAADPALNEVAL